MYRKYNYLLILEQILPRAGFHVISVRIRVLQRVPAPGQQASRIEQVLPVDPRAQTLHHLLVDARLQPIERLLLQLQRLAVVLPALVVVQILLQRLARLYVHRLVGDIRVLLVARALVVLAAVRLPVAHAHPAEVVLAVEALHVIAAAVLLDANVTLWTVLGVRTDVVGRLAVVRALGQPAPDHPAIGRRMIVGAALVAERRVTCAARRLLGRGVRGLYDRLTVGARTEAQIGMRLDIVEKGELLVFVAHQRLTEQIENEFFGHANVALCGHATHRGGDAELDLRFEVHRPAVAAEGVSAGQMEELVQWLGDNADGAATMGGGDDGGCGVGRR